MVDRRPRDWPQLNCHRKRAKHQLKIEPLCSFCMGKGLAVPATVADRVVPHRGDWNKFRLGKLQSLCKPCHDRTKQIEQPGYRLTFGIDGLPIDPMHPFHRGSL
jgi:hypothetical protein